MRIWRLLGKATSKARDAADYSRVVRVGTDDTAKRCDQSCISIMADLNHQRTITESKEQGSGVKALKEHTGDRTKGLEAIRDMAKAYSLGVAAAMPQAAQILDSVHVVAALHKGDRPCEVHAEARVGEEAQGSSRLKKKESLTEYQLAKREELDPTKTHLREAHACQMAKRCRTSMAAPTKNLQPKPQTGSVCG